MEYSDYNLLYKILVIGFFILGPVLPAFLLYKIAPDSRILGTGNFAGFKINATGASAIFIILFVALYPKIDTIFTSIDAYQKIRSLIESEKKDQPWKVMFKIQLMNDTSHAVSALDYEKYIKQDSIMSSPRPMRFDFATQMLTFYIDNDVLEESDGLLDGTLVLRNGFGTSTFKIDKKCKDLKRRVIKLNKKFYKARTDSYVSLTQDNAGSVRHFNNRSGSIAPPKVSN